MSLWRNKSVQEGCNLDPKSLTDLLRGTKVWLLSHLKWTNYIDFNSSDFFHTIVWQTRSQSFCEIHWSSSPSSRPWLKYRSATRTFTVYSIYSQHNSISGDWQKDLTSVFLPNVATLDCGVLTSSPVTQIIRLQLSVTVLRNSDQSMWNFSLVNAHTQISHFPVWGLPWHHVTDFFGHIKMLNFTNK